MQYVGGKSRIAKRLAAAMLEASPIRSRYVEPFVGGGAVLEVMAPHFRSVVASDIHPDLVALWRLVASGWNPPEGITEDDYNEAKKMPMPGALRGFIGFGSSFGGKWWGGYARSAGRNHGDETRRSLLRAAPSLRNVSFMLSDFEALSIAPGALVYCDPPYEATQGYAVGEFEHARFWRWAAHLSLTCDVFVSERQAPEGWQPIWEQKKTGTLAGPKHGYKAATEYLFRKAS